MDALLVIDVQNDFLPGGALAVPDGDAILPVVYGLMERFKVVVASQDWHPANHASFAANHPGKRVGERIVLEGLEQVLWPVHCVQGTRGAELEAGMAREKITHVVRKGEDPAIDSYSAFFDNGHRSSTLLADYLRSLGVTRVYLAGLATDYCVKFTALDALAEGFGVVLVEEACRGVELRGGDVAAAVEAMRAAGARVVKSREVFATEERII
jgi:nicotinamidase/pyrazinamidase